MPRKNLKDCSWCSRCGDSVPDNCFAFGVTWRETPWEFRYGPEVVLCKWCAIEVRDKIDRWLNKIARQNIEESAATVA